MQIFVQRMTGKTITIDASPSDTILQIKEKFHDKEGLLPAQQCLLFAGRELEDDKLLSDYSIQKEATLNVIERVFAPPLEAVAAAKSIGEIVAAFTRIAASVAAEPPTITISKVALIAACQTWREAHPGAWRGCFRVPSLPLCALSACTLYDMSTVTSHTLVSPVSPPRAPLKSPPKTTGPK